jgi:hypothetical protein
LNARSINSAAGVVQAAWEQGRQTAAGIAVALDAAGLLMSPETAAELVRLRAERHSTNESVSQADEALRRQRDRIAELETGQQVAFRASHGGRLLGLYSLREDALHHCEDALGRAAEYGSCPSSWEERPDGTRELFAWTSRDVSSGTGFTVAQVDVRPEFDEGWGEDADEPDGITRRIAPTQALREDEPAEDVSPQVAKLRDLLAGQRAAVEDPHDGPLAHRYLVPRDLPPLDGAR